MTTKVVVTHQEFFKVCNELQNQREVVVKECHNYMQVAEFIRKRLDINIAKNTVASALEAIGIVLERRSKSGNGKTAAGNNMRTLATALHRLYKKLGEEVPESLTSLVTRLNRGIEAVQSPPVPVSSIPDTKTIQVASNGKR